MSSRKKQQPRQRMLKRDHGQRDSLPSKSAPLASTHPAAIDLPVNSEALGMESMSDVLRDFAEPYVHLPNDITEFRHLFSLAILAWNASLLPKREQERWIEDYFEAAYPNLLKEELVEARKVVDELIQRKKSLYAANKRVFTSLSLTGSARKYRLDVTSTL